MKIFRWLLSHSFLILLIVIVIYGYMYWGNLLGKDTPAGKAVAYLSDEFVTVRDFVAAVKEKQARLNTAQPAQQSGDSLQEPVAVTDINNSPNETGVMINDPATKISAIDSADVADEAQHREVIVLESDPSEVIVAEKITTSTDAHHDQDSGQRSEQQTQTQSAAQVKTSAQPSGRELQAQNNASDSHANVQAKTQNPAGDSDSFVPADVEEQLNNVDDQGKVNPHVSARRGEESYIGETEKNDSVRADWYAARKSFYQRDYAQSEKSYQKVIANSSDNFDAYGELGNVYFNQGKNKQAAAAYYEAAAILVRKGQVVRAKSLMGLLRNLDKPTAEKLKTLIDSKQSL